MQDHIISIANAREILQSCTKPWIYKSTRKRFQCSYFTVHTVYLGELVQERRNPSALAMELRFLH